MKKPNRSGKSRVIILLVLCALVFGLFLARLIWMQFVQADYYAQKVAQASTTRYSYTVPAARGGHRGPQRRGAGPGTRPVWDVSVKYPRPAGVPPCRKLQNRTLQLLQMTGGEDVETQLAAFCSAVSAGEFHAGIGADGSPDGGAVRRGPGAERCSAPDPVWRAQLAGRHPAAPCAGHSGADHCRTVGGAGRQRHCHERPRSARAGWKPPMSSFCMALTAACW